jgi:hypothetical protein
MESLNDAVCGDEADYQFSTFFFFLGSSPPRRQYPKPTQFNSSVYSLYEQKGIQILITVT